MPAPTICAVSGILRGTNGVVLQGATVIGSSIKPFIHSSDGSLVVNYQVSTTTDSNGAWTLSLIETATDSSSVTISFFYPLGSAAGNERKEYTIIVPNSASANFSTLIGSQL